METPVLLNAGDELGVFHMGSTVVLLFENSMPFCAVPGSEVQVGEALISNLE